MFYIFGKTAGDYFCPNLSTISAWLQLSDSVAGVTLAAFGNGAPDLFSSFTALTGGSEGLGFGELFGAATFITMCVVGSVAIVAPFTLPRRPFMRDLIAFIGAISFMLIITADGKITRWESLGLIAYYLVYVTIVVLGAFIYGKQKAARVQQPALEDLEEGESDGEGEDSRLASHTLGDETVNAPFFEAEPLLNAESGTPVQQEDDFDADFFFPHFPPTRLQGDFLRSSPGNYLTPRPNLRRAVSERYAITPRLAGMLTPSLTPAPRSAQTDYFGPFERLSPLPSNKERSVSPAPAADLLGGAAASPTVDRALTPVAEVPNPEDADGPSRLRSPSPTRSIYVPTWRLYIDHLFPFIAEWHQLSVWERVIEVITAPVAFLLSMSIPVVHREEMELEDRRKQARERRIMLDDSEEDHVRFETEESVQDDDGNEEARLLEALADRLRLTRETVAMQAFVMPFFLSLTTGGMLVHEQGFFQLGSSSWRLTISFILVLTEFIWRIPVSLLCLVIGAILGLLISKLPMQPIQYGRFLAIAGFVVSMCWIFRTYSFELLHRHVIDLLGVFLVIANEVVGLLETIGLIAGVSESVLGLTVFAMGNSIGDFITNLSIARMGYPAMAVGACFGGPMLSEYLRSGRIANGNNVLHRYRPWHWRYRNVYGRIEGRTDEFERRGNGFSLRLWNCFDRVIGGKFTMDTLEWF
ncbi:hypothetical protein HK097_007588 [Rhizophlyctis rosea]|uniref:Sodium/calcium exchanger membrane region domain-containing protein n=1 Tax=Rhizophlyctis rosea TaxID=64517 RepID=A0AAD5SM97_9FUNG|nr:hypothetical protein HK097_007588 [Rhizophlyctis rosea]